MTRSYTFRYFRADWICLWLAFAAMGFGETRSALSHLPLSFEANQGQTDPAVKFLSRGDGYTLFLTPDSAVFKLRPARSNTSPAVVRMKLAGANPHATITGAQALPGTANYFLGSDPSRWTRGITAFGKVNHREIYRGIGVSYYGTERQLEYDFIVSPGADPQQIALEFSGANPTLSANGDLILALEGGPLTFRKPVVYQVNESGNKKVVSAAYELTGARVKFVLGRYDHNRTLVIDPVLNYLTYVGGSLYDMVGNTTYSPAGNPTQGVAVDQAGNVYITGYTQSTDFPVQNPIQGTSNTNGLTGFIAKLNPTGSQLIYATYIGGGVLGDATTTRPYAIAVDAAGSAYVTGYTTAPQFPVTPGAYQTVCGLLFNNVSNCPAADSAFLTKLSPSGSSLIYSTFLGHSNETAVAVAVDSHGQAYVAGNTGDQCASSNPANCFPTTPNAVLPGSTFNTTINPGNFNQGSAFISVFDAAGANLLYSSVYGGNGAQSGNEHPTFASGVAVDSSGYFYLVGSTESNQLPVTPGAFQTTYYGNPKPGFGTSSRGFVAKFNPVSSGASPVYATYLGGYDTTVGSYQDVVSGIAADAAGNAYVSGNASYDFPATTGANNSAPCPTGSGCQNRGFLAKLNPAGSALVWATFVGAAVRPDLATANTISPPRLDAAGNVYVSGIAGNNTEYPLVNPLQPANGFGGVYVTEYDPTGSTIFFSTVIYDPTVNGGVFNSGVDVDSQGNMYVAGYTSQSHLPTTTGAYQPSIGGAPGNTDAFIARISAAVPPPTIAFVVNAEGGAPTIAPNTWVEISGANLAPAGDSRQWYGADFVNNQMPTNLDGVTATVNGKPAYIAYISPTQVNILTPPDAISGPVQVQVTNNGEISAAFTVQAQAQVPSFFIFGGGPYVAATHADGSLIGPATLYPGLTTPAQPGETIVVYANGFGETSIPLVSGSLTQSGTLSPLPVITIGGVGAAVQFAGLVGPGEFQFNMVVPSSLTSGDQSITASYNGSTTQAGTLINVQQ